jgi:ribonuclease BN (tRNA processing enzyme)
MPATGPEFAGIGGNTSCVAISTDGAPPTLVIDAGTGLRTLSGVLAGDPFRGTILLSHLHWDHMMGLPFFRAGDRPDAVVDLLMPAQGAEPAELLGRAMSPPSFPITIDMLRGDWTLGTFDEGTSVHGDFEVLAREIPHKGGRTMGFRADDGHRSVAYLSDHSPHDLGPGPDGVGEYHDAAVALASGVDVLIHGAQFSRAELPARFGFGHAAADYGVGLGEHCGVGRVVLFHHDPWRSDAEVRALRDEVAQHATVRVELAIEGTVIEI